MKKIIFRIFFVTVFITGCFLNGNSQTTIAALANKFQRNVKVKKTAAKDVDVSEHASHSVINLQWKSKGRSYTEATISIDESTQEAERIFRLGKSGIASGAVTDIDGYGDKAFMVTSSYTRQVEIGFIKGNVNVWVSAPSKEIVESLTKQILAQIE